MAISVMPAASAIRTASAVGAETATITVAPIAAVFCTISMETRLVSNTTPSSTDVFSSASAPASLSSALWRPTSSRNATMPRPGIQKAAACTARVSTLMVCNGGMLCTAAIISRDEKFRPCGTTEAGRRVSAIESMPHIPQPVGPAMCRRRSLRRSALACVSHIRNSIPSSRSTISSDWISSGVCTIPSLRLNPTAKSPRFCGVPIITAYVPPLKVRAIAVSSGMVRTPSLRQPSRQTRRSTVHTGLRIRLLRGLHRVCNPARVAGLFVVGLLPLRWTVGGRHLYRCDLVFGAIGCPVGIFRRDDVGLRVRMMERGVDHARRDAFGDQRPQGSFPGTACEPHPVAIAHAALLGIVGMDLEPVFLVPDDVVGSPRLCADIVLAENASRRQKQWVARTGTLVGRDIFGDDELALAAHEAADVHHRRALRRLFVAGPLHGAEFIELRIRDARKGRRQRRNLVHDLRS